MKNIKTLPKKLAISATRKAKKVATAAVQQIDLWERALGHETIQVLFNPKY